MILIYEGILDHDMINQTRKEFNRLSDKINSLSDKLPTFLYIEFNTKLKTTGGTANSSKKRITLNYRLFKDNMDHLNQTFVHELCHIVANSVAKKGIGHGRLWQNMMLELGYEPNRCHNMDVSKIVTRHKYNCECGLDHNITTYRHNKIQKNNARYSCSKCRSLLTYNK